MSGIALAMRHRQQWYYHLWAHGFIKEDEHPAYTPVECGTVYFFTLYIILTNSAVFLFMERLFL